MSHVRNKVIDILADRLGKDKATITEQSNLVDDLGADSLDLAETAMDLEDAFGVRLDLDGGEAPVKTVADVIQRVDAAIKA